MHKPEIGQIIGGKYRLLREIGRGGMATVFEAEHTLTFKRAAVKWLHPQFHDVQEGLQRVLREARASSRIRHDNVVDVYDVAEEGSSVCLVMELLRGELLSHLLEREELPMHQLVALLVPAMRGVAAAHAAGVVHRDVKPDNIFLSRESAHERGVPKVIDFGISKVVETDPAHATRSGITMGTPRYVSYEQLMGARDVDARTDIYAFGVILYEALTGRAPYGEAITFAEQAVRFATQTPLPARMVRPEVPEALDALVQRAIAKQCTDRMPTLEDLLLALVPFADPGQYAKPLLVRSQAASRARVAELPGRSADTVPVTPSATPVGHESSQLERVEPTLSRSSLVGSSRRRGLALTVVGLSVMGLALISLPFEQPRRTHAERSRAVQREVRVPAAPAVAALAPQAPAQLAQLPAAMEQAPAASILDARTQGHASTAPATAFARAPAGALRPMRATRALARKPAVAPRAPQAAPVPEPATTSATEATDGRHRAGRLLRHEF